MTERKNKKNWKAILIPVLVLLLFAAGYLLSTGIAGEKMQQWFGGGESTAPPYENEPETTGDPGDEPSAPRPGKKDPGNETSETQPDKEEPVGSKPDQENPDKVPLIYVGQVLAIPTPGGGDNAVSRVITRGTVFSGKKQIALTFDSGWEYTHCEPLLKILDEHGIKATFFPRADWVAKHPELGRAIVDHGHTMGNHSQTHGDMTAAKMSAAEVRTEMRQSTKIIQEICGVRPCLFRPPYGAYDNRLLEILAEEGYPYTIMWSIDTIDWDAGNKRKVGGKETLIDENFIVNRVLENSEQNKNNGIVLMHIGGDTAGHLTVKALPRIIKGLRDQGYTFTTVDRMLPPPGQATHTVQKGDTLYSIARHHGVTVQQIIDANALQ